MIKDLLKSKAFPRELLPLARALENLKLDVTGGVYDKGDPAVLCSDNGLLSMEKAVKDGDFQCSVSFKEGTTVKDVLRLSTLGKYKKDDFGSIVVATDGSWMIVRGRDGLVWLYLARRYHVGLTVFLLQASME